MKLKNLFTAVALVGATTMGAVAHASPTITNLDGNLSPFGGFDWAQGSAAWTVGFLPVVGDTFVLNYAGWASNLTNTFGNNLHTPRLDSVANGTPEAPGLYEYTIFASLTEEVISITAGVATFRTTGGSFAIYYDTGTNANITNLNWTGFTDGIQILGGTVNASVTNQTFNVATGGQADLTGVVTFTNNAFINPALIGTNLTSTLQLAAAVTNFTPPTSFQGVAIEQGSIRFQADANQAFTVGRIPEPSALLLAGLALVGAGIVTRRRAVA